MAIVLFSMSTLRSEATYIPPAALGPSPSFSVMALPETVAVLSIMYMPPASSQPWFPVITLFVIVTVPPEAPTPPAPPNQLLGPKFPVMVLLVMVAVASRTHTPPPPTNRGPCQVVVGYRVVVYKHSTADYRNPSTAVLRVGDAAGVSVYIVVGDPQVRRVGSVDALGRVVLYGAVVYERRGGIKLNGAGDVFSPAVADLAVLEDAAAGECTSLRVEAGACAGVDEADEGPVARGRIGLVGGEHDRLGEGARRYQGTLYLEALVLVEADLHPFLDGQGHPLLHQHAAGHDEGASGRAPRGGRGYDP